MIDDRCVSEVNTMSEVDELREKLSTAIQILRWELADMWGHVSCRTSSGDSFLLLPLRPPLDQSLPEADCIRRETDEAPRPSLTHRQRCDCCDRRRSHLACSQLTRHERRRDG